MKSTLWATYLMAPGQLEVYGDGPLGPEKDMVVAGIRGDF